MASLGSMPLIRAVDAHPQLQSVVCATAQHREMLNLALDVFGIQPDIDLDLMQPGQQLADLTARVVQAVTGTLRQVQPDFLLVQEEAPSLGKPVLVMRETTERPEGVEAGAALLVGTNPRRIMEECERLLHDPVAYARMASVDNPFGDGHAGGRIANAVAHWLGGDPAEIRLGESRWA